MSEKAFEYIMSLAEAKASMPPGTPMASRSASDMSFTPFAHNFQSSSLMSFHVLQHDSSYHPGHPR